MTPLNVAKFEELLRLSQYDSGETKFLIDDFSNGFDIGYEGPTECQSYAENIPIMVGSTRELWDKIMKELKLGRYAGLFDKVPFDNFIQSPIGLVPKAGNKTRLIFHLSYEFTDESGRKLGSVNSCTPRELCSVKYCDLDTVVAACLRVHEFALSQDLSEVFLGKTDLSSAFRVLPLKKKCYCWLVMKAVDPKNNKIKYFVEKCLPFSMNISCSHYQRFSNALKHILKWRIKREATETPLGREVTNYLDNFLFLAFSKLVCDGMICEFLRLCTDLNIPVALEKTEWSSTLLVFLGILMDGKKLVLSIPIEKQKKALNLINEMLDRKKATVKELQILTGYVNFLTKVIFAGRTFTRRMYSKYAIADKCAEWEGSSSSLNKLKSYHHIRLDVEFKLDCHIW